MSDMQNNFNYEDIDPIYQISTMGVHLDHLVHLGKYSDLHNLLCTKTLSYS